MVVSILNVKTVKVSDKKYTCIIIDDEFSGIRILEEYISLIPKLALIKSYANPAIAVREIKAIGKVDFLFLDINMAISGLDIATILRDYAEFIFFVTGHPEHALAAFGVQGDKFLVKPVDFRKFVNTINQSIAKYLENL